MLTKMATLLLEKNNYYCFKNLKKKKAGMLSSLEKHFRSNSQIGSVTDNLLRLVGYSSVAASSHLGKHLSFANDSP